MECGYKNISFSPVQTTKPCPPCIAPNHLEKEDTRYSKVDCLFVIHIFRLLTLMNDIVLVKPLPQKLSVINQRRFAVLRISVIAHIYFQNL